MSKLRKLHQQALTLFINEPRKTQRDLAIIDLANEILMKELTKYVPGYRGIAPRQIHFFQWGKDVDIDEDNVPQGLHEPNTSMVFIDKTDVGLIELLYLVLHEATHVASHHKFIRLRNGNLKIYRVGYEVFDASSRKLKHFHDFDEAVVDLFVLHLFIKYGELIMRRLNIKPKQFRESAKIYYGDELKIVIDIIWRMAQTDKRRARRIRERIVSGLFTGQMMHLRSMERALGVGSLRFLAALGRATRPGLNHGQIARKAKEFFSLDDPHKRLKNAKKILIDSEYLKLRRIIENSK